MPDVSPPLHSPSSSLIKIDQLTDLPFVSPLTEVSPAGLRYQRLHEAAAGLSRALGKKFSKAKTSAARLKGKAAGQTLPRPATDRPQPATQPECHRSKWTTGTTSYSTSISSTRQSLTRTRSHTVGLLYHPQAYLSWVARCSRTHATACCLSHPCRGRSTGYPKRTSASPQSSSRECNCHTLTQRCRFGLPIITSARGYTTMHTVPASSWTIMSTAIDCINPQRTRFSAIASCFAAGRGQPVLLGAEG